MKPIIFFLLLSPIQAQAAHAQTLAEIRERPFGLFEARENMGCTHFDSDRDGINDASVVWVRLGAAIDKQRAPGLLQNPYIENTIKDLDGRICRDVETILRRSHMNFGAVYGDFDSVLRLENGKLVEDVVVRVRGYRENTEIPVTLRLKETVTKELR